MASAGRGKRSTDVDDEKLVFETSGEVEVLPTFDEIGLREDLLRGLYAYGKPPPRPRPPAPTRRPCAARPPDCPQRPPSVCSPSPPCLSCSPSPPPWGCPSRTRARVRPSSPVAPGNRAASAVVVARGRVAAREKGARGRTRAGSVGRAQLSGEE